MRLVWAFLVCLIGAPLEGAVDEDVDEEQQNQQRCNTSAQVHCFSLPSHPESGRSAEHVKVQEKIPDHVNLSDQYNNNI